MTKRKGQVLIVFAASAVALIAAMGLVVDLGILMHARAKARNAADGIVLAGAMELRDPYNTKRNSQALTTAKQYALQNGIDPDTQLQLDSPYNGDPDRIQAVVTLNVPLYLMRIFGQQTSEVRVSAVGGGCTGKSPNLLPIGVPDTAPPTCRLWGPNNQCNDTRPSGGGTLGAQYKGLVDLRTCDEAAETSTGGFESSSGASNFYIPLKSSTSGTYPSTGTTSDSVTLTSSNSQSSGWLELSWTFEDLPTDVNSAKITMQFQDLDLQGDFFYRYGKKWVSLFETFELKDPDGNTLATLDSSAPYDDNFTWEFDLPTELFTSDTLTLTARLTAEVTRYCCSSATLSNSLESIQSIKIEGTAGSAAGDSDCTPFDAADDYRDKSRNVKGWIQNGCNCTIYEGNDMASYEGDLGQNVGGPLEEQCGAQGLSDDGGSYGLFTVLVYDQVNSGSVLNITGYAVYKIYCDKISRSSASGTFVSFTKSMPAREAVPEGLCTSGLTG